MQESVTLDPFVFHGHYEMLKKEVERLGIQERPECFYNWKRGQSIFSTAMNQLPFGVFTTAMNQLPFGVFTTAMNQLPFGGWLLSMKPVQLFPESLQLKKEKQYQIDLKNFKLFGRTPPFLLQKKNLTV